MTTELETLLNTSPSPRSWVTLLEQLDALSDDELATLRPRLSHWPDAMRIVPGAHFRAVLAGQRWRHRPLCTSLSFFAQRMSHQDLDRVLNNPVLAQFTHLGFSNCRFDPQAARLLAASPHLGGLTGLDLGGGNNIGDDGLEALTQAPWFAQLEHLDLWSSGVGAAGMRALADAPMTRLRHLKVSHNKLRAAGAIALAQAQRWPALEQFEAHGILCGDAGATALAAAPWLAQLKSLSFSRNALTASSAAPLAEALRAAQRLQYLHMDVNSVGGDSVLDLTEIKTLRFLSLKECGIDDQWAQKAAQSQALGDLRELTLSANPVGLQGARALLMSTRLKRLESLGLWKTSLGTADAKVLAALKPWRVLKECYLPTSAMGFEGNMQILMSPAIAADQRQRSMESLGTSSLKAAAKALGLRGYSKLRRDELRELIRQTLGF